MGKNECGIGNAEGGIKKDGARGRLGQREMGGEDIRTIIFLI
jgi:hypothetical protein